MSSTSPDEAELYRRLSTLETSSRTGQREDLRTTPLMTLAVKNTVDSDLGRRREDSGAYIPETIFNQYAVLGFHTGQHPAVGENEPILMNVNAPNSAFICGSQGSGKSYTLNCMLENCLIADRSIGRVTMPIAGVAFHYDPDSAGAVAETAYICSMGIHVDVLVSQSNEHALRAAYSRIPGADKYLTVKPLLFRSSDLSTERMLRLMAFGDKDSAIPLYMSVAQRILRQMAIDARGGGFDYNAFKVALEAENLTREQSGPLSLRLEILESFLNPSGGKDKRSSKGLMDLKSGTLTIVDLTDPFVDPATACILFDTCLSLAKERRPPCGLVVALDEAHKYMTSSLAASKFTDRLLETIREQRHNATRVIIATQEPTISEKLLDLCSISVIHRFTSPAWYASVQSHLGAASKLVASGTQQDTMFDKIMNLKVGESLVFAPSAFLCLSETGAPGKLGRATINMKTRARLGSDGGMSILTCAPGYLHVEQRAAVWRAPSAQPGPSMQWYDDFEDANTVSSEQVPYQTGHRGFEIIARNVQSSTGEDCAVPDCTRSHLVLICCMCENVVAIEFPQKHLPTVGSIDRKDLRGAIAYATCVGCMLRKVKGSSKSLKEFDQMKGKDFPSGDVHVDEYLRDILRSRLGSTLGHKITVVNHGDRPAYVFSKIVKRAMQGDNSLWTVRLDQAADNLPKPVLSAYRNSAFFED